jgi:L-aspartate semialdehyde sulfurtransferase ferredoxin
MLTRLRLDYPPELVSRPVVAELISKFQLEVNILRAQVSRDEGWLIVELAGDPGRVAAARKWLSQEGLLVTENPDLDPAG